VVLGREFRGCGCFRRGLWRDKGRNEFGGRRHRLNTRGKSVALPFFHFSIRELLEESRPRLPRVVEQFELDASSDGARVGELLEWPVLHNDMVSCSN